MHTGPWIQSATGGVRRLCRYQNVLNKDVHLKESFETLPPVFDDIVGETICEDFARKRGNGHA
jgi:hypothetical protein